MIITCAESECGLVVPQMGQVVWVLEILFPHFLHFTTSLGSLGTTSAVPQRMRGIISVLSMVPGGGLRSDEINAKRLLIDICEKLTFRLYFSLPRGALFYI